MTLARLGDESSARFGEYEALAFEGRGLTNVDQHRVAGRVAHALRRLGVDPCDRLVVSSDRKDAAQRLAERGPHTVVRGRRHG